MDNIIKKSIQQAFIMAFILSSNCVMAGELQLGLGVINDHSAIQGKSEDTGLLPVIMYEDENFSFMNGTLSYRIFASDGFSIAVTGQPREKKYEPKDSEALNGMDKRDDAFDAGFNIQLNKAWGTLEMTVLGDMTSTYDGYEIKTGYSYPWIKGRWLLKPAAGVSYLSEQLVGYYYGIKNSEKTIDRAAYSGNAGVNSFVEISVFYELSEAWTFIAGMEYRHLDDAITKSPVVDESYEAIVFSAMTYSF